jgi:Tol biopolymer transport system component
MRIRQAISGASKACAKLPFARGLLLALMSIAALPAVASATFPGQNGRIAYTAVDTTTGTTEIWTVNPDGSDKRQLTNNTSSDQFPRWSPDGRQIVFVSDRSGANDAWVMNADGSNQRNLTGTLGGAGSVQFPSWSPDGQRIVFAGTFGTDLLPELYTVRTDGSQLTPLTNNQFDDFRPVWSPDGQTIAFVSIRNGNADIFSINATGGNEQQLTNNVAYDGFPNWTPDSQRIVFRSNRNGSDFDVWIMDRSGGNEQQLNTGAFGTESDEFGAAPSPDGTQLAFSSNINGDVDIFVAPLTNIANARDITNQPGTESSPDWQALPNGGPGPGPGGLDPSDFKNRAKFCKAVRDVLGSTEFRNRYGNGIGGCVSGRRGDESGGNADGGNGKGNGKGKGKKH